MLIGLEFILIITYINNVIPMGANFTELAQRHLKNEFFCPISALTLWNAKPVPPGCRPYGPEAGPGFLNKMNFRNKY